MKTVVTMRQAKKFALTNPLLGLAVHLVEFYWTLDELENWLEAMYRGAKGEPMASVEQSACVTMGGRVKAEFEGRGTEYSTPAWKIL